MNNAYSLYIESVLKLANTLVIKSEAAANALNLYVTDYLRYGENGVDTTAPETWKYYKNLAGEYHYSDTEMTVVSSDTLETIVFSKENLLIHRATARAYQFGTRQYNDLVSRYPEQETLILGILYPVDKAVAIAAKDHTIIGWAPGTVELNEYTLIARLQKWIDGFQVRWHNPQFAISDSLYTAAQLGILYLNLVPAIITERKAACKTSEAHSFHVTQYLASHSGLSKYVNQLTLKQSLWLYRNIAYIEANFGKQDTFDWLVEHIMTERKLPVGSFTMRHDVTDQPEEIYPTLSFKKGAINQYNTDLVTTYSLDQMLAKEDPLARANVDVREVAAPTMLRQMRSSLSNVVATKMVESAAVDRSNNTPYTLPDILLAHWLDLSQKGLYNSFITIIDPVSGEPIPLSVKDAFPMMFYAFGRTLGIDFEFLPSVIANRVQRTDPLTPPDLLSIVDRSLVSEDIAIQALAPQPVIEPMISTESFYETGTAIFNAAQLQRRLIVSQEHFARRGQVHGMVSYIYNDALHNLADPAPALMARAFTADAPEPQTYANWFAQRSIQINAYSVSNYNDLYLQITKDATGLSLSTKKSLKDLQDAMMRIMGTLSSYSVQYNKEINASDIRATDWTTVRVGDVNVGLFNEFDYPLGVAQVTDVKDQLHSRVKIDVNEFVMMPAKTRLRGAYRERVPDLVSPTGFQATLRVKDYMFDMRPTPLVPLVRNARNIIPVFGTAEYLLLTPAQQAAIPDLYGSTVTSLPAVAIDPSEIPPPVIPIPDPNVPIPDPATDLDEVLQDRTLPGFDQT